MRLEVEMGRGCLSHARTHSYSSIPSETNTGEYPLNCQLPFLEILFPEFLSISGNGKASIRLSPVSVNTLFHSALNGFRNDFP